MKLEKSKYILAQYVDRYICETVKGNISEREWTGKKFVEIRRWEPVEPETSHSANCARQNHGYLKKAEP